MSRLEKHLKSCSPVYVVSLTQIKSYLKKFLKTSSLSTFYRINSEAHGG